MRRLVGRPGTLRPSRLNVEELECRAQPALLGLSLSIHAAPGLDQPGGEPAVSRPALTNATSAHGQTEIAIHFGGSSTPPTDSGTRGNSSNSGTAAPPQDATPQAGSPVTLAVFSTATATAFSSAFAREAVAQQAVAAAVGAANLGVLLPPGRAADSATALATAANSLLPPDSQSAQAVASQGNRSFPGAESIPYLGSEGRTAVALFDPAGAPAAAAPVATARPGTAAPVKASMRLDRVIAEAPADLAVPPAIVRAPAAAEEEAASADATPTAPVADEGTTPTWVWASVLGGVTVGTAWVAWQYWLKPPPALRPDERAWRNYLLGLDFDQS